MDDAEQVAMIASHAVGAMLGDRNLERATDDAGDELVELERVGSGGQQCPAADASAADLDEDAVLVFWDVARRSAHFRSPGPHLWQALPI